MKGGFRGEWPMAHGRAQGKIIGLTGTYCAGKNHVGRLLEERGLPVLDVDKLGHRAIEAEREAILGRFGGDILGPCGAIDRRLLGAKVFGRPDELAALEGIVHPAANRMTSEWIAEQQGRPCVVNAALLHKSSAFAVLSCVILVRAPTLTRLLRARKRDSLPISQLLRRFGSQREFAAQYASKKTPIYLINNRGYFGFRASPRRRRLEARIDAVVSQILARAPD
jgi:dephospho-CoA kinase